jgi:two-component system sensor kinase FixL
MASLLPRLTSWDDSLFETVVAATLNGVVAINDQGLIRVFNSACERMFHYPREEMLGHPFTHLLASPYREEYEALLEEYLRTGISQASGTGREVQAQRKDGTTFPVFFSLGEGAHHGKPVFVAVIQDLSDLKFERAVHAEERAFLAAIVDSSNDAIISKTLSGKITSWNKASEKLFGYSAAEMLGTPITRLFPEDRLHEEAEIIERIKSGESLEHYETQRCHKDGSLIDVSVTVSPIKDSLGTVIGASKTVRDITEQKQTEIRLALLSNELNHVARLSEMGQISAALAHELNQPLAAVLNYTNLARRLISTQSTPEKTLEAVDKASEQAIRAGQIIKRLRDFVTKRESTRTLEDISEVAEDAVALGLVGSKTQDIRVETEFSEGLPLVLMDRIQIQQVLVNLLRNAAEAMAETPRRELTLTTERDSQGMVAIRVADTGVGIDAGVSERLFSPFVTTKPSGMGIGLAISRSIVESHGGKLWMLPNPGGGTVFQFTLPSGTRMME